MYVQFLIEDKSTEKLVCHVMEKLKTSYPETSITYDTKAFGGIGHLPKTGTPIERKTGQLLNELPMYLRAFNKKFCNFPGAVIIVVLDNDTRDPIEFQKQLEDLAIQNMILTDHVFCVAVKEMEAWLLGDIEAIEKAYPKLKKNAAKDYVQDGITDTWEVLANMVYPGGLKRLKGRAGASYHLIGEMKAEWADKIGIMLELDHNLSPSFQRFIYELKRRVESTVRSE